MIFSFSLGSRQGRVRRTTFSRCRPIFRWNARHVVLDNRRKQHVDTFSYSRGQNNDHCRLFLCRRELARPESQQHALVQSCVGEVSFHCSLTFLYPSLQGLFSWCSHAFMTTACSKSSDRTEKQQAAWVSLVDPRPPEKVRLEVDAPENDHILLDAGPHGDNPIHILLRWLCCTLTH